RADALMSSREAGSLALSLLRPGPQLPETPTDRAQTTAGSGGPTPTLDEGAFRDLLEVVMTAALNATPRSSGGPGVPGGGQNSAQVAQNNAHSLLMGLQSVLPQVDKYLPMRAPAVRQKLTDIGVRQNPIVMDRELS